MKGFNFIVIYTITFFVIAIINFVILLRGLGASFQEQQIPPNMSSLEIIILIVQVLCQIGLPIIVAFKFRTKLQSID